MQKRADMPAALDLLAEVPGVKVKKTKNGITEIRLPGTKRRQFATGVELLERSSSAVPLAPLTDAATSLAEFLSRSGEHLPLQVTAHEHGASSQGSRAFGWRVSRVA